MLIAVFEVGQNHVQLSLDHVDAILVHLARSHLGLEDLAEDFWDLVLGRESLVLGLFGLTRAGIFLAVAADCVAQLS